MIPKSRLVFEYVWVAIYKTLNSVESLNKLIDPKDPEESLNQLIDPEESLNQLIDPPVESLNQFIDPTERGNYCRFIHAST